MASRVNDSIRKLPGVQHVDIHIHLIYHKMTYAWPPGSTRMGGRDA